MNTFTVRGGHPLYGSVPVSGAKNAALPILFGSLVTSGRSVIRDLPDIGDVRVALRILSAYGVKIERRGDAVVLDTTDIYDADPPEDAVSSIRASSYLLGACLSRFSRAKLLRFGGCNFAARPIDMHLSAMLSLGGVREGDVVSAPNGLSGAEIVFPRVSVGATVNALLLAVSARGKTVIRGAATEPHVSSLVDYLRSAGARIFGRGTPTLTVFGKGEPLSGGCARVIPDAIEACTYLLLPALLGGEVSVSPIDPREIAAPLSALGRAGVSLSVAGDSVSASGKACFPVSVECEPYPGFPTDLQPPFAAMLSVSGGEIVDRVFPERFGYLSSLSAFGVSALIGKGSARVIPSRLVPASVEAPDLRGGAACLLAALAADGESEIRYAERILRGYEGIARKITSLGGEIALSDSANNNLSKDV